MTESKPPSPRGRSAKTQQPLTFPEICRIWARHDHWPLVDAIRLSLELPPRALLPKIENAAMQRKIALRLELAVNCIPGTLEVINAEVPPSEFRVRPREFLLWNRQKHIEVPTQLSQSIEAWHQAPLGRNIRPDQADRVRVRVLAKYLWDLNPRLSTAEMIKRPEIHLRPGEPT
jgi:hypothetical protein